MYVMGWVDGSMDRWIVDDEERDNQGGSGCGSIESKGPTNCCSFDGRVFLPAASAFALALGLACLPFGLWTLDSWTRGLVDIRHCVEI